MKNGIYGIIRTNNPDYGTCVLYNSGGFDDIKSMDQIESVFDSSNSWSLLRSVPPSNCHILWKKAEPKTPQQLAIEELEASIKSSQDKLTALKATL